MIGAGSFGEVTLSWWEGGHMNVAVKANGVRCINKSAINNERELLELLARQSHANILTVHGIVTDAPDGNVRIVMEYCEYGSLDKHLESIGKASEVRVPVSPVAARPPIPLVHMSESAL